MYFAHHQNLGVFSWPSVAFLSSQGLGPSEVSASPDALVHEGEDEPSDASCASFGAEFNGFSMNL